MKDHKSGHDQLFYSWCKAYFKDPKSPAAAIKSKKINHWHKVYDDIKAEISELELSLVAQETLQKTFL